MKKEQTRAFWVVEYEKAKRGEKTITDEMSSKELEPFKRKPTPAKRNGD